jgi:midasin (ATPase involved in ribosome maturation)
MTMIEELVRLPDGGQKTVWYDGVIVKATRTGGVLHIDEFSLFDPEVATQLHELLDQQRRLSLEGITGR